MEPQVEVEKQKEVPVEKDPKEFLRKFFESDTFLKGCTSDNGSKISGLEPYSEAILERRKQLGELEPVTDEEIKDIYLGSDNAKALMIMFARDRLRLGYDEKQYPTSVNVAVETYRNFLRMMGSDYTKQRLLQYPPDMRQEKLREQDEERQFKHDKLAKDLMEAKIVPNIRLGRVMGRLLMIDSGDDTFDMIQKDESGRYKRLAGVIESQQLSHG